MATKKNDKTAASWLNLEAAENPENRTIEEFEKKSFFLNQSAAKELKQMTVDHDTTLTALFAEAINLLFDKYDRKAKALDRAKPGRRWP